MGMILNENNEIIAATPSSFTKSGRCKYSFKIIKKTKNARCYKDYNLLDAKNGKITNAKKYCDQEIHIGFAIEINNKEYYIC